MKNNLFTRSLILAIVLSECSHCIARSSEQIYNVLAITQNSWIRESKLSDVSAKTNRQYVNRLLFRCTAMFSYNSFVCFRFVLQVKRFYI